MTADPSGNASLVLFLANGLLHFLFWFFIKVIHVYVTLLIVIH